MKTIILLMMLGVSAFGQSIEFDSHATTTNLMIDGIVRLTLKTNITTNTTIVYVPVFTNAAMAQFVKKEAAERYVWFRPEGILTNRTETYTTNRTASFIFEGKTYQVELR